MSDLKNPMRFSIRNREIDIEKYLRHPEFQQKQVDKIEIQDGQLYVHWSEDPVSESVAEIIERWRHRAEVVEEHGGDHEEEIVNRRNEWNIGTWLSMANELEANVPEGVLQGIEDIEQGNTADMEEIGEVINDE